jgi:hypothetical protein
VELNGSKGALCGRSHPYLIEVTLEVELVLRPDSLQARDEFPASSIPFAMIQPPLTNTRELLLEPTGHDIHGDASAVH